LRYDYVFAGGGLANTLAAYRLRQANPNLQIAIIERAPRIGGNHTWSFHGTDLTPAQHQWLQPFIAHNWPRQEVRFPGYRRELRTSYHSATSDKLAAVAARTFGDNFLLERDVEAINHDGVTLAGGETIESACVIDGRGARGDDNLTLGYQKFVGKEVRCARPHGQSVPIIMDATVPQQDGYRFIYTLPMDETRILVEDTYYSDGPELNDDAVGTEVDAYAQRRGFQIAEVVREERGILPIVLTGDINGFWASSGGIPRSGMRAALFHPTTGYSLPDAVRFADLLAARQPGTTAEAHALAKRYSITTWRQRNFFRVLNRFLFFAAEPDKRAGVMERFYTLPEPLIERFYACRLKPRDKARILIGRPPVPISRALQNIWVNHPVTAKNA
jgi:lycopene beta-cyclase